MLLIASGCSRTNFRPAEVSNATVRAELPIPSLRDTIGNRGDYHIGPGDKLTVSVFNAPELGITAEVNADGTFPMPLLGSVQAMGETSSSMAASIERTLAARYVRQPHVTVLVAEAASQQLTVEGGVMKPGEYTVTGRTTLLRAIAIAGGFAEFGQKGDIVIFRTIGDQSMVARFDIRDIRGGRSPDPEVFGNDVIVVGDNSGRKLFKDLLALTPLLSIFYLIR